MQFWEHRSEERRTWAQANYTQSQLRTAIAWSKQTTPRLTGRAIKQIGRLHSHWEWEATHSSDTPAPSLEPIPHASTAPLIHCMPTPSLPPFLAPKSTETHAQQVTRARLALGRARTGCVRLRFAKAAEASTINPHCTHCSTPAKPVLETITHMLTACLRHTAARLPPRTAAGLAGRAQPGPCHSPHSLHASRYTPSAPALPPQQPPRLPPRHLRVPVRHTRGQGEGAATPPRHGLKHRPQGQRVLLSWDSNTRMLRTHHHHVTSPPRNTYPPSQQHTSKPPSTQLYTRPGPSCQRGTP